MSTEQANAFEADPDTKLYEGQIHSMIAELAFSYAEERGFDGGDPKQDWLRAERSVKEMLAGERENRVH